MDDKPIAATEVVKDPALVYQLGNAYIMLRDTSVMGTYKNMIEAINLLAERGWETVSISLDGAGSMYALCRDTNFKRKNEMANE
jgi:hypothetical protein